MVDNFSTGGFFVQSSVLLPVGTPLPVSLVLPLARGPKPLVARARVRWINDPSASHAPEQPVGVGIESPRRKTAGPAPRRRGDRASVHGHEAPGHRRGHAGRKTQLSREPGVTNCALGNQLRRAGNVRAGRASELSG
jgi:hypothetical protein